MRSTAQGVRMLGSCLAAAAALALAAPGLAQSQSQSQSQSQGSRSMGSQGGGQEMSKQEKVERASKLRDVSGEVVMTKEVEVRGTGQSNLVALLKTDKGDRRLAVDLGPVQDLQQMNIVTGSQIEAQGRVVQIRDRQFLVAHKVRAGGETIDLARQKQRDQLQRTRKAAQPTDS